MAEINKCFRMIWINNPGNDSFHLDLNFSEVAHIFHYNTSLPNKCFGCFIIAAILIVNLPLLRYIHSHGNNTFLNKLIAIDCCICIGNIGPVISTIYHPHSLCLIITPFSYFINSLNRLLVIGIVFYRYVFVHQSSWVGTQFQRKTFCLLVAGGLAFLSTVSTALCVLYREKYYWFLACEGRLEAFYYNTEDFFDNSVVWSSSLQLPFHHPFHLLAVLPFLSCIILVPIGYTRIFKILQRLENKKLGLSEEAMTSRKKRNLVSVKFNFLNWLLETYSIFLVSISINFDFLYIFFISCGPPLLYFMGIEENRKAAQEYFKSNIQVFKKNNQIAANFDTEVVEEIALNGKTTVGLNTFH